MESLSTFVVSLVMLAIVLNAPAQSRMEKIIFFICIFSVLFSAAKVLKILQICNIVLRKFCKL